MKNTILSIFLIFSLYTDNLQAQYFEKVYDLGGTKEGLDVLEAQDGSIFLLGRNANSSNDNGIFLLKVNGNGDKLWNKLYPGSINFYNQSIIKTSDGNYLIACFENSQIKLIKINEDGQTIWSNLYAGGSAGSITETSEGDFLIVGKEPVLEGNRPKLLKVDADGNLLWTKTYAQFLGGGFEAVFETAGHKIMIGGVKFFASHTVGMLINLDEAGNILWHKLYGEGTLDIFNFCVQTNDNGYVIGGSGNSFDPEPGNGAAQIMKVDSIGAIKWMQTAAYNDQLSNGNDIFQDQAGNYYVTGRTSSNSDWDLFLAKLDIDGQLLWTKSFEKGRKEMGESCIVTQAGDIVAGGSSFISGTSDWDAYIVKTNADGLVGVQAEQVNEKAFHYLYPNPNRGDFSIGLINPTTLIASVTIFNAFGQKIHTKQFAENQINITLENPPAGVYFYQIEQQGNLVATGNFLVQ
jgi:hypothetical protein